MNYAERKTRLGKRIGYSSCKPVTCKHVYGDVVYDPETIETNYGGNWMDGVNATCTETVDRWRATCEKCGQTFYTTKIGSIACAPIFD